MAEMNERPTDGDAVDGFTDTEGETTTGSPDPGVKYDPLSPDEYAAAEKEIREGGNFRPKSHAANSSSINPTKEMLSEKTMILVRTLRFSRCSS